MTCAIAVGVECVAHGQTPCLAVAEDGSVIAADRVMMGINYHEQEASEVARRLYRIVSDVLRRCPSHDSEGGDSVDRLIARGGVICAGITGVTTGHERNQGVTAMWKALELPPQSCLGTGDAEVLLAGETCSLHGAVVVWHAGSVAYARGPKSGADGVRVGGLGPHDWG